MPTITLYSKPNCPLCDHTRHYLRTLLAEQPDPGAWVVEEVSILDDQDLYTAYRELIPVVVVDGGAPLAAPESLDVARLRQALQAAAGREPVTPFPDPPAAAPDPLPVAGRGGGVRSAPANPYGNPYYSGPPPKGILGAVDRLGSGLTDHWLAGLNTLVGLFSTLPWLAPIFAALGWWFIADPIYTVYMFFCHQLPERCGSLFGYQVAYCYRNTAIYSTVFLVGLLYARARRGGPTGRLAWMLRPLSWQVLVLLCLPMAVDGLSHLLGLRETNAWFDTLTGGVFGSFSVGDTLGTLNWWLRIITGTLFGFAVVRFAFPWIQFAFQESRRVIWAPPPRPVGGAPGLATS